MTYFSVILGEPVRQESQTGLLFYLQDKFIDQDLWLKKSANLFDKIYEI